MSTNDRNADQALTTTHWGRAGALVLAAAKRVLWALLVLIGVSVFVFVVMRVLPGDIVDVMFGDTPLSNADRQSIRRALGYDKPLPEKYVEWVSRGVRLDFGNSLWTRRPVTEELGDRVGVTVELVALAVLLQAILWTPLAVLGRRSRSNLTIALRTPLRLLSAVPGFWFATVLIVVASSYFGWIPPLGGIAPLFADPWVNLQQFVAPAFVLSFTGLATVLSASVAAPAARPWESVTHVWRQVAANGVYHMALLLSVGVVIETVFSLPGVGQLTVSGIYHRDIPQLEANLLTFGFLMWTVWCVGKLLSPAATPAHGPVPALEVVTMGTSELRSKSARLIAVDVLRGVRRPSAFIPLMVLLSFGLLAIAAPVIAPYHPLEVRTGRSLMAPSLLHLLGTDELGRDILSRVLFALRPTLGTAIVVAWAVGLSLLIYHRLSAARPALRPMLDGVITVAVLVPATPLAFAVAGTQGTSFNWLAFVPLVLAGAICAMQASRTGMRGRFGAAPFMPALVFTVWAMGDVIMLDAVMSFLGLGPHPRQPTLGGMLSGSARSYMSTAPWLALAPGVVLTVIILCFHLLGEALQKTLPTDLADAAPEPPPPPRPDAAPVAS